MRKNQDILFATLGVLLVITAILTSILSIRFLAVRLTEFFGEGTTGSKQITKFNLKGLEDLGIVEKGFFDKN
jgi:hypothetical protein